MSWLPMVRPRRRARSASVKSPSGLRQSVSVSASLASSSGRCSPASRASWASALCAGLDVDEIGQPVKEAADHRDMAGAEVAVALGFGGGGQHRLPGVRRSAPVRSPRSAASWMRRDASARVIRNRLASAAASLPPNSVGIGLFAELVDQRVLDGRQPAAYLLAPLQDRQPLGGGQHVEAQIQRALDSRPRARRRPRRSLPDY